MGTRARTARVVTGEQGTRQNVLGDNQRVLLTGQDTGGTYAVVESTNPPGIGIPLHLHRHEDEMFYVVDGQVEFQIGDEVVLAGPGTTIHMPRDLPHAFKIVGDAPAKLLVTLLPAGLEDYFVRLSHFPQGEPPDMAEVVAISARYGIEFLTTPTRPII